MSAKTESKKELPEIRPGDTIKVIYGIKEKEKTKSQSFEGVLIKESGVGKSKTITVRKISYGIGVEKIFPLNSPFLLSIEVIKRAKTRRAKLFYLRKRVGKRALKVKELSRNE